MDGIAICKKSCFRSRHGNFERGTGSCEQYPWVLNGVARINLGSLQLPTSSPARPMIHDPIDQSVFESDIVACLFRFEPLVFQNLIALCLELSVQSEILDCVFVSRLSFVWNRHGDVYGN